MTKRGWLPRQVRLTLRRRIILFPAVPISSLNKDGKLR